MDGGWKMKTNKAKINYIVDVVIGIGFLLAAVSGVVLLLSLIHI